MIDRHCSGNESAWPHRIAVLLACATFPMLFIGAMVTTVKAGMAVPDWPTTFGYNPFAYPLTTWIWGPWDVFVEHGHRLLGWFAVGPLSIVLVVSLWRQEQRAWVRAVGLFALALVVGQGVLGGMRVRMNEQVLAQIHGCVGPVFFATVVALCVFTSRLWKNPLPPTETAAAGSLQRLALLTTALAYAQLVVGAELRHLPPDAAHQTFRLAVVFHLLLAAAVTIHAGALLYRIGRRSRGNPALLRPAIGLVVLVLTQIVLGGTTWILKYGWPGGILADWGPVAGWTNAAGTLGRSVVVTSHVALGSLILVTSLTIALRTLRLLRRPTTAIAQVDRVLEAAR